MVHRGLNPGEQLWRWLRYHASRTMLNVEPDGWPGGSPTFSMMDGGRIFIPVADGDGTLREFYQHYFNGAAFHGEWFALSENRTRPVARLFFDVDAKVLGPNIALKSLHAVGQHVARTVGECVVGAVAPAHDGDAAAPPIGPAIVLAPHTNSSRVVCPPLDGGAASKLSLHIVFPEIAVEDHVADAIRHVVAARLDVLAQRGEIVPLAPEANGAAASWLTALDPSSALRVPFSHKVERCECNPKKERKAGTKEAGKRKRDDESWSEWSARTSDCPAGKCCNGWIPLLDRGVFRPFAVYEVGTGRLLQAVCDQLQFPTLELQVKMLTATSIRVPPGTPPSPHFTWESCLAALARITGTAVLPSTLSRARAPASGEGAEWTAVPLTDASSTTAHLLSAVRAHHAAFRSVQLAGIRRAPSGHAYRVDVSGPGADRCLNLLPPASTHKCGASLYFLVSSREGVTQRCACWSNSGQHRRSGKHCKDFKSTPTRVPVDAQAALFPPPLVTTTTTARFAPRAQPATAWRRKVPPS